jgi:hypothetical protein
MKGLDEVDRESTRAWCDFADQGGTPKSHETLTHALDEQRENFCKQLRERRKFKGTLEATQFDLKEDFLKLGAALMGMATMQCGVPDEIEKRCEKHQAACEAGRNAKGGGSSHDVHIASLMRVAETMTAYVETPSAFQSPVVAKNPGNDVALRGYQVRAARQAISLAFAAKFRVKFKEGWHADDVRATLESSLPALGNLDRSGVEAFADGLRDTDWALVTKSTSLSDTAHESSVQTRSSIRRVIGDVNRIVSTYRQLEDWYRGLLEQAGIEETPEDPVLQELAARFHVAQMLIKGGDWFTKNYLPEGEEPVKIRTAEQDDLDHWVEEQLQEDEPAVQAAAGAVTGSSSATPHVDEGQNPAPKPLAVAIPDAPQTTDAGDGPVDEAAPAEAVAAAQAPARVQIVEARPVDELLRCLAEEERRGEAEWRALALEIGDIPMASTLARARRHYAEASKLIREIERQGTEAASALPAGVSQRIARKVRAMGEFQQHPIHSLKIGTPTPEVVDSLRSAKEPLTLRWPGDLSALRPDQRGWFIEVELGHAAVLDCQPAPWYLHVHLNEGVDPTKPDWTLTEEDVSKAHIKIKGSRTLGGRVSRCHLENFKGVVNWIQPLGKPQVRWDAF